MEIGGMIKTLSAKFISPKALLGLVISALLVGLTIYLVPKKLDERGICWAKGRVLNDEELYQNAMRDFVQNLLDEVELSRGDRPGSERAEAEGPFFCRRKDCDVWIAPAMTYDEVEQLRDKFAKVNMYANKPANGIQEMLSWNVIHEISQAGDFKQANNEFVIVNTMRAVATYYPTDCCEIYAISDWQNLRQKYFNRATSSLAPYPNSHKYLLVKSFFVPEIDLHYDGKDGAKYFATQQYPSVYGINSCGHMQEKTN